MAGAVRATARERRSSRLVVGSFTKAAATEIAGRGLPVDRQNVGTLHALAYRAIERPTVVGNDELADWNKNHPGLALSEGFTAGDLDEDAVTHRYSTEGDGFMGEVEILRAQRIPLDKYPNESLRHFAIKWEAWKRDAGVVDFTDMIELALANTAEAPGDPVVGFFDEAQDFTPLELALVRHWGKRMERLVLAADDDQAIYAFKGVTPDGFLDPPIPGDQKRILSQSYRVPREVHAVAQTWVEQLTRREPKDYEPRDADGEVRSVDLRYEQPMDVVDDVVRTLDEETLDPNTGESRPRTVMLLASCSYMLDKIKHELRSEGIPFHNPYRRRRGDWNPLTPGKGVGSGERLLSYLVADDRVFGEGARLWTGEDIQRWANVVKKPGIFRRGAAGRLKALPSRELTYDEVVELFDCPADELERILEPDLDWFAESLLKSSRSRMDLPLAVARRDPLLLAEEPRVILGTIHCSPPDEPILTKRGWVPIGNLDEEDRLVGYHSGTNSVLGGTPHANSRGYAFERSVRPYSGDLVTIETDSTRTRVTPNHRVVTRFDEDAFCGRWAVYLMRRGPWWRVGICTTAHRPYKSGGVSGRLATEQADDGWILSVHETQREALMAEAIVQGTHGVPGLTFRARSLDDVDLAVIHDSTSLDVGIRAKALLDSRGLSEEWPLYSRRPGRHSNMRGNFVTEAANLVALSGRIQMLTSEGERKPTAKTAVATTEHYDGPVYGLDVPPHHHYISGGNVVHNSVKGGQADKVYLFPDLSLGGMREWTGSGDSPDSVIRLMYVGMTRAREELLICQPSSPNAVDPHLLTRGARV